MRIPPRPAPRRPARATPQIRDVQRVFPTGFSHPPEMDFHLTDRRPAPPRRSFTEGTQRRGSPVRRPRPRGQGRGGGGRTTRGDGVPHVRRRRRVERSIGVGDAARGVGSIRRSWRGWQFKRAEDVARVSAIVLQRVAAGAAGARAPGEVLGPRLRGGGARAGGSVDGFHRGGFGGVGGG